jgi:hypothetical protein
MHLEISAAVPTVARGTGTSGKPDKCDTIQLYKKPSSTLNWIFHFREPNWHEEVLNAGQALFSNGFNISSTIFGVG